jgi:hypothetical protein
MASHTKALAGNGLAVSNAFDKRVANNVVLVLANQSVRHGLALALDHPRMRSEVSWQEKPRRSLNC